MLSNFEIQHILFDKYQLSQVVRNVNQHNKNVFLTKNIAFVSFANKTKHKFNFCSQNILRIIKIRFFHNENVIEQNDYFVFVFA